MREDRGGGGMKKTDPIASGHGRVEKRGGGDAAPRPGAGAVPRDVPSLCPAGSPSLHPASLLSLLCIKVALAPALLPCSCISPPSATLYGAVKGDSFLCSPRVGGYP